MQEAIKQNRYVPTTYLISSRLNLPASQDYSYSVIVFFHNHQELEDREIHENILDIWILHLLSYS